MVQLLQLWQLCTELVELDTHKYLLPKAVQCVAHKSQVGDTTTLNAAQTLATGRKDFHTVMCACVHCTQQSDRVDRNREPEREARRVVFELAI